MIQRLGRSAPRPRRLVLATLVAISFSIFAVCWSSAAPRARAASSPLTPVSFGVFTGGAQEILLYAAQDQGFFKKYGIDASFVPGTSAVTTAAALVGGSINVADINPSAEFPLIQEGTNLVSLLVDNGWVLNLIAQKNLPLPDKNKGYPAIMKDLVGKTVGVAGLGATLAENLVKVLLEKAGLSPDSVTFVAVGSAATAVAAFKQGTIQVLDAPAPEPQLIGADDYQTVVNMVGNPKVIPYPGLTNKSGNMLVSTWTYVNAHKTVVNNVCKAIWAAWKYVEQPQNESHVVQDMASLTTLPTTTAKSVWDELKSTLNPVLTHQLFNAFSVLEPSYTYGQPASYVPSYSTYVYSPCASSAILNK
jgi:NitT/TauT family transport system substrate-binding protein